MEGKKLYVRTAVVAGLAILVLLLFFGLLYHYELVAGVDEEALTAINTVSSTQTTSAARGLITDRDGEVLVGNHTEYQVTLSPEDMGSEKEQGAMVLHLLDICDTCGVEWTDTEMPISQTRPYTYTAGDEAFSYVDSDTGETQVTRLGRMCDAMGWKKSPDAEDLIDQMKATFGLEGIRETTARAALGVLYSCYLRENEILWTEYAFVSNAGIQMISIIEEEHLAGVSISSVSVRQFNTSYAAHLLGQTGYITAENWTEGEDYKDQGYSMDAIVGLSGVEYAFESYLKGTDGTRTITQNSDGDVISEEDTVPALAGCDVALTLDYDLQVAAEDALAEYTAQINGGEGGSAAVVIDVSDGSVLACASWPTYDPSTLTYDEDYAELSPLFNRALQGTYAPGSTYKMVTATAGLETGVITPYTQIRDTGYMDYYGTTFRCWLYRQSGGNHGLETVSDAIRDSCNIFFYNVGIGVGIDTLTEYAQAYGLGLPTGIELTEATGVNAGPEYSASVGATWYGGNLLSASIGQSDNLFTPLQIANYIATLVNGGNRYAAHLLQSYTDANGTVTEYTPEILGTVSISDENLQAIKTGMLEVVTSTTTVRESFANLSSYGITVGAKTGSAQVGGGQDANGLFVCFAPYDNPEIAVCIAVEKGGSGADTSIIAARILEAYFGIPREVEEEEEEGEEAGDADAEPGTQSSAPAQRTEDAVQTPTQTDDSAQSNQTQSEPEPDESSTGSAGGTSSGTGGGDAESTGDTAVQTPETQTPSDSGQSGGSESSGGDTGGSTQETPPETGGGGDNSGGGGDAAPEQPAEGGDE